MSLSNTTISFDEYGDYCPGSETGFTVTASASWYIQAFPFDQHQLTTYSGTSGTSGYITCTYGGNPQDVTTFHFYWASDGTETGDIVYAVNSGVGEECFG